MAKSAILAIQAAAIMAEKLRRLEALNAKVTKKRNIKIKYITQEESLIIEEGIQLLEEPLAPPEGAQSSSGDATPKASNRAPRHCSGCGSTEHTARTCPALRKHSSNVSSTQN